MKTSINAWSFPAEYDFEQTFKKASELGFECIELNLDAETDPSKHAFHYDSDEVLYSEVRELSKKYNVKTTSVSTSLYWSVGAFGADDENKRDEALKVLRKQIEIAKGIGATAILCVPCVDAETGLKKSFENTIKVFRSLKKEIKKGGVEIGFENVWNGFFMSPFDVKMLLDKIDNSMVGIYFDVGNMVEFSNPLYWTEIVAPYIKRIHIKDFKRNNDACYNGGVFCKLLEGDVDFEKVIPMIKASGYDFTATSEVFPSPEEDIDEFLTRLYKDVKTIVDMAK